jgi:lipid-A-disaccharide synthase-like uncharacterized protein
VTRLPYPRIILSLASLVAAGASVARGAEPGAAATDLVERVKNDPAAIELIRNDPELMEELEGRVTPSQVLRELRTDPSWVWYRVKKTAADPWVLFGFGAQALFLMRFVIQWIASERRKRSHVPISFWYFSLAGGITLFVYAARRLDPVFMLGQGLGCFIYIRNLILIHRRSAPRGLRPAGRTPRAANPADTIPP